MSLFRLNFLSLVLVPYFLLFAVSGELVCNASNDTITITKPSNITAICSSSCVCDFVETEQTKGEENVVLAFVLTIVAGLSTTIGAAMVFVDRIVNRKNEAVLAISLAFSGGIMLYVSFGEIFVKSEDGFTTCDCLWVGADGTDEENANAGNIMATICLFLGILSIYLLDLVVMGLKVFYRKRKQKKENRKNKICQETQEQTGDDLVDQEIEMAACRDSSVGTEISDALGTTSNDNCIATDTVGLGNRKNTDNNIVCLPEQTSEKREDRLNNVDNAITVGGEDEKSDSTSLSSFPTNTNKDESARNEELEYMGIMTAVVIGFHNFPEGLATFVAALDDPKVGAALAVAIIIHNIPEGLCISIPIYYATGSRWKGFWYAFWSGVTEIVGAVLGYAFLKASMTDSAYAVLFGLVAGMMIGIVLKELIPTAIGYDPNNKFVSHSLIIGMLVMALSLIFFKI